MSEKLSAAAKMMDGEVVTLTDDIIFKIGRAHV